MNRIYVFLLDHLPKVGILLAVMFVGSMWPMIPAEDTKVCQTMRAYQRCAVDESCEMNPSRYARLEYLTQRCIEKAARQQ